MTSEQSKDNFNIYQSVGSRNEAHVGPDSVHCIISNFYLPIIESQIYESIAQKLSLTLESPPDCFHIHQ